MKSFVVILLIFILTATFADWGFACSTLVITVPFGIVKSLNREKDPNHKPWWCSLRL